MGVSNYFMNRNVATVLAIVILSNDRMCRDLLSLGFDTLGRRLRLETTSLYLIQIDKIMKSNLTDLIVLKR